MALISMPLYADLENNAYIYFDRVDSNEYKTCIIYRDHYYIAPMPEHYKGCPCLAE